MATTVSVFLNKFKTSKDLPNKILIFGEEVYYADKIISHVKNILFADISVEEISCNTFVFDRISDLEDFNLLEENVLSCGFFATVKLVVIKDTNLFRGEKTKNKDKNSSVKSIQERLLDLLEQLPGDCYCLFIINRLESSMRSFNEYGTSKLYKHIDAKGVAVNCTSPRYYEIREWMVNEIKTRKLNLDPKVLEMITDFCSHTDTVSISMLCNEFDKLDLTYGKNVLITKTDFVNVSQLHMQFSAFRLVEFLFQKNADSVAKITIEVLAQGTSLEMLVALLCSQIKRGVQLKVAEQEGMHVSEFAELSKMSDYALKKLRSNMQRTSLLELKKLFVDLVDFQYKLRTSRCSSDYLVILLVNFCQKSRKMI